MVNFVQKSEIFRKFPEIADDHNSRTEYARDMKFVSKCVVLDTLLYSTNNSISIKSGFRPFWKWALHIQGENVYLEEVSKNATFLTDAVYMVLLLEQESNLFNTSITFIINDSMTKKIK